MTFKLMAWCGMLEMLCRHCDLLTEFQAGAPNSTSDRVCTGLRQCKWAQEGWGSAEYDNLTAAVFNQYMLTPTPTTPSNSTDGSTEAPVSPVWVRWRETDRVCTPATYAPFRLKYFAFCTNFYGCVG